MKIDKQLVREIAKTARIELNDDEIAKFEKEMNNILEAFSKICAVKTDNVEMSIHPIKLGSALREDRKEKCLTQEEALSLTNNKKEGYFTGPRAV